MTATLLAGGSDGGRRRVRVGRLPELVAAPPMAPPADSRPRSDGREAAGRAAMRYLRVCVEVLNGFRPVGHLRSLGGPAEFAAAVAQLRLRRNGRGHFRPASALTHRESMPADRGRVTPLPARTNSGPHTARLSAVAPQSTRPHPTVLPVPGGQSTSRSPRNAGPQAAPFVLTRLVVCEPIDGIAEIVALLSHADSTVAVAMRLERRDQTWVCTIIQVV